MHTKRQVLSRIVAILLTMLNAPCSIGQADIVIGSEADQIVWVNTYLAEGMPKGRAGDTMARLVRKKTAIMLPLLEREIERILSSKSPLNLFADQSINPQLVVESAASMIAYGGNEQALMEISKLIRIDEQRFESLVSVTLDWALSFRNPFTLVYQGLAIGDPLLNGRIVTWAEKLLTDEKESTHRYFLGRWAEEMVERYGKPPTKVEWANDPLVYRLEPAKVTAMEYEMERFAKVAAEKRVKK